MAKKKVEPTTAMVATARPAEGPVDLETGEITVATAALPALDEPGRADLRVSQQAVGILTAPLTDEQVDVLPTGEVYLSQVEYRRRLLHAFGPGSWALVPVGEPLQMTNAPGAAALVQRFDLWINRRWISTAYGEAEYHPDNPRTTWATAWESAKSNALMRTCKDIGIATECWDRRWTDAYRTRRCIRVWRKSETKPQWRRLDSSPWYDEKGPTSDSPNAKDWRGPGETDAPHDERPVEGARPVPNGGAAGAAEPVSNGKRPAIPITKPQQNRLFAILRERAAALKLDPHSLRDVVREYLGVTYHIDSAEAIRQDQYDDVVRWVQTYTLREPGDES